MNENGMAVKCEKSENIYSQWGWLKIFRRYVTTKVICGNCGKVFASDKSKKEMYVICPGCKISNKIQ
ncbi:hypothetical protein C0583_06790 [Candidatus Parcubacteria bacterium]|nr:MAG: hypothetical protein C0583_06790 [Candidatus Parcubacteria bacterium]